jgi:hypothetical protein
VLCELEINLSDGVKGRLVELLEPLVYLRAVLVGHVAGRHNQLVQLANAVVLFGSHVHPMATFALLATFRAVVFNVPF